MWPENIFELRLDEISEDIYAETGQDDELTRLPNESAIITLANLLTIFFVIDLYFIDGRHNVVPITSAHLARWHLSLEELSRIASNNATNIPIECWLQLTTNGTAYEYPNYDKNWTGLLLSPTRLTINDDDPLILVPCPDKVLLADANDRAGKREALKRANALSDKSLIHTLRYRSSTSKWEPYPL